MGIYHRLERKFGHLGIPGLIRILAVFRVLTWLLAVSSPGFENLLIFDRAAILRGEVWRMVTFIFIGLGTNPLFLLIEVLFMFFISDGLERAWGPFGVTAYIFGSGLAMAVVGILIPLPPEQLVVFYSCELIFASLVMAFACLYPDVEILLFFVIPMKMKYVGMMAAGWPLYWLSIFFLKFPMITAVRVMVLLLATFLPFLLVFLPSFLRSVKVRGEVAARRHRFERSKLPQEEAFHRCVDCGATELSDSALEFRVTEDGEEYCEKCLAKKSASG